MEKATFIRDLDEGFSGHASLYKLSKAVQYREAYDKPPLETNYVIVSAANVIFSGPETYIFPADKDGTILDWLELSGSFKGGLDHKKALAGAGYDVE